VRATALKVQDVLRANAHTANAQLDTDEPSKMIASSSTRIARGRSAGRRKNVADTLQAAISGAQVAELREANRLVSVEVRGAAVERPHVELLESSRCPPARATSSRWATSRGSSTAGAGHPVAARPPCRRSRRAADIYDGATPPFVNRELDRALAPIKAALPPGLKIETGGHGRGCRPRPGFGERRHAVVRDRVLTILMFQLRSFSRVMLVVLTAPLGMIGVTPSLLVFGQPFGFVAMLGTIAPHRHDHAQRRDPRDQIEQDLAAGSPPQKAVGRRDRAPLPGRSC